MANPLFENRSPHANAAPQKEELDFLTPEENEEFAQLDQMGQINFLLKKSQEPSPSQTPQQDYSGAFGTIGEALAPLSSAAWEHTKDMPDEWDSAEGLKRKGIRAAGMAGDVGLAAAPFGKVATAVGSKIAKPALKLAGDVAYASHGGALAKEANVLGTGIKSGFEGAIDGAIYDTAANTAREGELTGPGIGAPIGGAVASGLIGTAIGKRNDTMRREAEKTRREAQSVKTTYKNTQKEVIKEQHNAKKAIMAGASSSNENINFAQRTTGLKGEEAIKKVIGDNIKPGQSVGDVIDVLKKENDKAEKLFDDFIMEYGDRKLNKTPKELGEDLMYRVRDSAGIGFQQDENIGKHFLYIYNNDLAALARQKMQRRGYSNSQIDDILKLGDELNMNNVYKYLDNSITLNEIDQIKRNMWAKTGLFRRNALSMQEAGEKNIASQQGGFGIIGYLRDYSDKEIEILERIGGSIDGELNKTGARYLANKKAAGEVDGKMLKLYLDINKQRSNIIGTAKIFNGAMKSLERSGKGDMRIYPSKEWHRLAKEAVDARVAETRPDFPQENIDMKKLNEMTKPYVPQPYFLDRLAGQLGQRAGRIMVPPQRNSLGLTPPRQ